MRWSMEEKQNMQTSLQAIVFYKQKHEEPKLKIPGQMYISII